MFDVSFTELLIIGVVALVVIGPERLPKVARTVGHLLGRAQRYVNDVKSDIQREIELDELRKFKENMDAAASDMQSTLRDTENSLRSAEQSIRADLGTTSQEVKQAAAATIHEAQASVSSAAQEVKEALAADTSASSPATETIPSPSVAAAPAAEAVVTPAAPEPAPKNPPPTGSPT